jgi:hypothetical protein
VCLPQFDLGCLSYDELSFDEGASWEDACCEHIIISDEFHCKDDCELENKNINRLAATAAGITQGKPIFEGEGIEWYADTYSGEEHLIRVEFVKNAILLNGEVITRFSEQVNAVKVTLPGWPAAIILKSSPS